MADPSSPKPDAQAPELDEARTELDRLAATMEQTFRTVADAGGRVEDAPIEQRKVPFGVVTGVLFPPEPHLEDLICALGPCAHYSHRVIHLETKNEEVLGDGIAHAERIHWCEHFGQDLDLRVFDCSAWRRRYTLDADAPNPRRLLDEHIAKIRIRPVDLAGFSTCRICNTLRERSGVVDWANRQ